MTDINIKCEGEKTSRSNQSPERILGRLRSSVNAQENVSESEATRVKGASDRRVTWQAS